MSLHSQPVSDRTKNQNFTYTSTCYTRAFGLRTIKFGLGNNGRGSFRLTNRNLNFLARIDGNRRPDESFLLGCVVPTVKHGGVKCRVWTCFAGNQVGVLTSIDGIMLCHKVEPYIILCHSLQKVPFGPELRFPTKSRSKSYVQVVC